VEVVRNGPLSLCPLSPWHVCFGSVVTPCTKRDSRWLGWWVMSNRDHRWIDRWMDGWMDGWMDDGWTEIWMDE